MKNRKDHKPAAPLFEQLDIFELLNPSQPGDPPAAKLEEVVDKLGQMREQAQCRERAAAKRPRKGDRAQKAREAEERREAHIREVTCMDLPLDWENVFQSDERARGVHADSPADALVLSLTTLGRVDIEYMASVTGLSCKEVIGALRGSIYQDPMAWNECFYEGWVTADEYLSGNLKRKWREAREANRTYKGYFADNLEALQAVLPPAVTARDIYVTLGSPWVPTDVIDDFITHIMKRQRVFWMNGVNLYGVKHDELTGTWEVPNQGFVGRGTDLYGTRRLPTLTILERTLNMKSVTVTDEVRGAAGKKRVPNKEETLLALEKQQKLIDEFQSWVWKDPARKKRLEDIFENNFACVRRRVYDGSFLTFPTMSPAVTLYPYQKDAVARILFSPNTLLAHDVGSGKTYVMAAAGMELRRMGLSQKNLYVVPNNLVGQWRDIFLTLYPQARLLVVEPKTFTPARRQKVLERLRDEDWDGIIMAYSCFGLIPLSRQFQLDRVAERLAKIRKQLDDQEKNTGGLRRQEKRLEKELGALCVTLDTLDSSICFDQLGVTRLFVDEAHNFKNVPIETQTDRVLGISGAGSKKCAEMLSKARLVQKNGGGVVMATGTPITNSITDAFVMQKYLQDGELALLDLQSFDSWVGMFAERVTGFEVDVDTSGYRLATRFAKFHNLPELTALFSQIADFHRLDRTNGIPDMEGYTDALIARTPDFAAFLRDISARADAIRAGGVSRTADNMLKLTTDGRQAALDMRLVDPNVPFTWQSKVGRCAENVARLYRETDGTQLVFCDTSTPKESFNLYDELRRLLVTMGVAAEEIAFVHDADTEAQRDKLFARMRKGEARVLMGSTFKLGLGVNVQDRLIALHHLDVPWRPADMTQREGRILRQGNQNQKVYIYRYITEGSFDAYSWQLLETKQRFITGLLSGSYSQREGGEIDETVLNYAEVKALAVGDPLVKKRVETANELSRCLTLRRKTLETHLALEQELRELPARVAHERELLDKAQRDRDFYRDYMAALPVPETAADKKAEADRRKTVREALFRAVGDNELQTAEREFGDYRGFHIFLPANMRKEKPYIWLRRAGRYYIELGDTEVGGLIRIDHFLDNLDAHIRGLEGGLAHLEARAGSIRAALENEEDYTVQIERLKKQLASIDKKLGVDQK